MPRTETTVKRLDGLGLAIDLPDGWDGRIYRRTQAGGPEGGAAAGTAHRAIHAATFALPPDPGDYGSGAVEKMRATDVLVILLEFGPEGATTPLFAGNGVPSRLRPESFSPNAMPRAVPGRTAAQFFFSSGGRAFCLYVVLGSHAERARLARVAESVVTSIRLS